MNPAAAPTSSALRPEDPALEQLPVPPADLCPAARAAWVFLGARLLGRRALARRHLPDLREAVTSWALFQAVRRRQESYGGPRCAPEVLRQSAHAHRLSCRAALVRLGVLPPEPRGTPRGWQLDAEIEEAVAGTRRVRYGKLPEGGRR